MRNPSNPPVTPSAAAHAERILQGEQQRAKEPRTGSSGQQTYERYAALALDGHAEYEAATARALGRSSYEPEPEDDVEVDDVEAEVEAEEEEPPPTTVERYAAIELERRAAEHEANRVAWKSVGQQTPPQVQHGHAEQLARPHGFADQLGRTPAA